MKKYKWQIVWAFLVLMWGGCLCLLHAYANEENSVFVAADMAQYDGVTVSADGTAWTTNYMDCDIEQYEEGYTIYTGVASMVPTLQTGEHFYRAKADGEVPVVKWEVQWSRAQCIHSFGAQNYHGFDTSGGICRNYYHSGWFAYCAMCEEPITDMYVYASRDTLQGIVSMPASSNYLYICPFCNGLEQGANYEHQCKKVSCNHYTVSYDANAPEGSVAMGDMVDTNHMYNNAAFYDGQLAGEMGYDWTKLRKNAYQCLGYVFTGWNDRADGTGAQYEDQQEVLNLCSNEGDAIILYAQWRPAESTLLIDANGEKYLGDAVYEVTGTYGTEYVLEEENLTIATDSTFSFWEVQGKLNGSLTGKRYSFGHVDGATDTIKARFVDAENITPDESLKLYAEEDYQAWGGVGAVDLWWQQKASGKIFYKVFQSANEQDWHTLDASGMGEGASLNEKIGIEMQGKEVAIPWTGYYKISAFGGSGENYRESQIGGNGGGVEASYWLRAGDVIRVYAGEQGTELEGGNNGSFSSGGNATSEYGRGGGAATEVYVLREGEKIPLLIAGGGGGANATGAGGDGGGQLTSIGISQGMDSEYGGCGGGAIGGDVGTIATRTTLLNPAIEDVAFRSHITEYFPSGTVAYVVFNNYTDYPTMEITGEAWAEATSELAIGGLNKTLEALRTNYVQDAYGVVDLWGENIIATASKNSPARWSAIQTRGGFCRTFVATYPTNGNTNLVVSGAIESWSGNVDGYIRFRILNAQTGEELYDVMPVSGFSGWDGNVRLSKVLTWEDFDVSGVEEVTVEIYVQQISGEGAQTKIILYDTYFYGKLMSEAGGTLGGTSYINTEFGCKDVGYTEGVNVGDGYAEIHSLDIGYQEEHFLSDVYAPDLVPPEDISYGDVLKISETEVVIEIIEPEDYGSTYYHKVESYRIKDATVELVNISNVTQNTLISGVAGYHYYVSASPWGTVKKTHQFTADDEWSLMVEDWGEYIHIAPVDRAGNLGGTITLCLADYVEDIFELTAVIYKEDETGDFVDDNIFKRGEKGVLLVEVGEYMERIEIRFPDEWLESQPGLNVTMTYDGFQMYEELLRYFFIPIEDLEGMYDIEVVAYKGNRKLTCTPSLIVNEESVIDGLRTRIRNNG